MYDECEKYVLEYGCKPTYTHGFPLREEIVRCRDCVAYEPYHTYAGMKLEYNNAYGTRMARVKKTKEAVKGERK